MRDPPARAAVGAVAFAVAVGGLIAATLGACASTPGARPPDPPVGPRDPGPMTGLYAERRLFAGAPPVIPHGLEEDLAEPCLTCHLNGGEAGLDRKAPATAHPDLENCRQCHVAQTQGAATVALRYVPDSFRRRGDRAHRFAPPTVPHPVDALHLRCTACHSTPAPRAIRTRHPERSNCSQCHLPTEPRR